MSKQTLARELFGSDSEESSEEERMAGGRTPNTAEAGNPDTATRPGRRPYSWPPPSPRARGPPATAPPRRRPARQPPSSTATETAPPTSAVIPACASVSRTMADPTMPPPGTPAGRRVRRSAALRRAQSAEISCAHGDRTLVGPLRPPGPPALLQTVTGPQSPVKRRGSVTARPLLNEHALRQFGAKRRRLSTSIKPRIKSRELGIAPTPPQHA
ncbi:atherin-like [Camponotus floridanus]|uniref:atherin-like n=1 Tax=Camponotus floridanus TaxID=104421 RepID=UPI00059CE33F|nr:atherin-like [Camponotus floridanus]